MKMYKGFNFAAEEWKGDRLKGLKVAVVDGKIIKENTWYTLRDGEFVEVENG